MRPLVVRIAAACCLVVLLAAPRSALAAAQPAPPSDAELTKYVAVQDALAGDVARREQICALMSEDAERDSGRGDELAAAARRAESNPIFGPLLRRQGLTGRRYVELSVQIASVLIGAAIAEESDAAERRAGRPAKGREALLASSPEAPPILARQQDLTRALTALQAVCAGDEDDGSEDEDPEESGEG